MGRHKQHMVAPGVFYEPRDATLVNQTIDSSITDIVYNLQTQSRYEDYVYNKTVLNSILYMLGPIHRAQVDVEEIMDDTGDFLCWKISRIPKRHLKEKTNAHKSFVF